MAGHGRMTTERAKDFKGTLRQLLSALGKYRLSLGIAFVFAVLSTIFNIAGPKVLAKATTALATGWIAKLRGTGGIDFAYIGKVLLFLLWMYLFSAAFSSARRVDFVRSSSSWGKGFPSSAFAVVSCAR